LKNKGTKKSKAARKPTSGFGITVKGKGNAFILSLLAVSVALVGFAGLNQNQVSPNIDMPLIQNEFISLHTAQTPKPRNLVDTQ